MNTCSLYTKSVLSLWQCLVLIRSLENYKDIKGVINNSFKWFISLYACRCRTPRKKSQNHQPSMDIAPDKRGVQVRQRDGGFRRNQRCQLSMESARRFPLILTLPLRLMLVETVWASPFSISIHPFDESFAPRALRGEGQGGVPSCDYELPAGGDVVGHKAKTPPKLKRQTLLFYSDLLKQFFSKFGQGPINCRSSSFHYHSSKQFLNEIFYLN